MEEEMKKEIQKRINIPDRKDILLAILMKL